MSDRPHNYHGLTRGRLMCSPCTRRRHVVLTSLVLSEMEAESGSPESRGLRGRCQTRFLHSEDGSMLIICMWESWFPTLRSTFPGAEKMQATPLWTPGSCRIARLTRHGLDEHFVWKCRGRTCPEIQGVEHSGLLSMTRYQEMHHDS